MGGNLTTGKVHCTWCGAVVVGGRKYCAACGHAVAEPEFDDEDDLAYFDPPPYMSVSGNQHPRLAVPRKPARSEEPEGMREKVLSWAVPLAVITIVVVALWRP